MSNPTDAETKKARKLSPCVQQRLHPAWRPCWIVPSSGTYWCTGCLLAKSIAQALADAREGGEAHTPDRHRSVSLRSEVMADHLGHGKSMTVKHLRAFCKKFLGDQERGGFRAGYDAAREQAAKIAAGLTNPAPDGSVDTRTIWTNSAAALIAESVRSMTPEPKEK